MARVAPDRDLWVATQDLGLAWCFSVPGGCSVELIPLILVPPAGTKLDPRIRRMRTNKHRGVLQRGISGQSREPVLPIATGGPSAAVRLSVWTYRLPTRPKFEAAAGRR